MEDTEIRYNEDTASVERGRSGLEQDLQDCMTKAKLDSQQWRTAQDSLMSLGEQNVASVDSIVRTGMETNQLLRVNLSYAASTALEDVNVASNSLLSSIDSSLKLDHDACASIDSIISPSRNELRALKSVHYHKTVEITANSDKYLDEDYVVYVPSCSTPKKRLINLPSNTSLEELRTPAFEDLLKSFWEAKSASKQVSNEDVKHFLGRHEFQIQASRDFNERVPLVDIN